MNLVLKLISSPWFWLDVALSISGGIFVWRGLVIEKRAEKLLPPENFKPDIFADIVEKYRSEIERGWRILMRGIIIEVVAALGISIISGLEIADLTEKSATANLEAEQAGKDAAVAKLQAGKANERAANTESNNLTLSLKLAALELKTQPRTIMANARGLLIKQLSNGPKGKVDILASVLDAEATEYAEQIEEVLTNAGYEVYRPSGLNDANSVLGVSQSGLHIVIADLKHPPRCAGFIQRCFMNCGISMDGSWAGNPNFDTNKVEISVGQHF